MEAADVPAAPVLPAPGVGFAEAEPEAVLLVELLLPLPPLVEEPDIEDPEAPGALPVVAAPVPEAALCFNCTLPEALRQWVEADTLVEPDDAPIPEPDELEPDCALAAKTVPLINAETKSTILNLAI